MITLYDFPQHFTLDMEFSLICQVVSHSIRTIFEWCVVESIGLLSIKGPQNKTHDDNVTKPFITENPIDTRENYERKS